jgi:hypothetical protein
MSPWVVHLTNHLVALAGLVVFLLEMSPWVVHLTNHLVALAGLVLAIGAVPEAVLVEAIELGLLIATIATTVRLRTTEEVDWQHPSSGDTTSLQSGQWRYNLPPVGPDGERFCSQRRWNHAREARGRHRH